MGTGDYRIITVLLNSEDVVRVLYDKNNFTDVSMTRTIALKIILLVIYKIYK